MSKFIEFVNVTKRYPSGDNLKEKVALNNINVTIKRGEFTGILGMNGSGKSTFARLVNALLLPTAGKIFVNGMDTSDYRHLREIRRNVGMVFQNPDNQIVSSIVEEDIAFGPENLGLSEAEVRERVDWAVGILGLAEVRHHAPHLLSGGQKQKVALAAALAMQPSCLILDEPTSMLDQQARAELMKNLTMLNQAGITIILITHNVEDVIGVDHLIIFNNGSVHLEGTPASIFSSQEPLGEIGFYPPDIFQLINSLKQRGLDIDADINDVCDLAEYICKL